MKQLFLLSFLVCLLASTQASFLRVINTVAGSSVLDVYYNVQNSNDKVRLFKDLNSTDVPPYFYITVPEGNSSVSLTFNFKASANESQISADQLSSMPTYNASIRSGNFSYTLIVSSSSSQSNTSNLNNSSAQSGGSSMSNSSQNATQGNNVSSGSPSNYQFLLLNDRVQGDQPPSGILFIRLVNLAPAASSISLVMIDAQCPQQSARNQSRIQENQSRNQSLSRNQTLAGNQTLSGNQTISGNITTQSGPFNITQPVNITQSGQPPLVNELPYFEASDYVELPEGTSLQMFAVCYQGQKIPVEPSPLINKNGKQFSILLFTGTESGNQSQRSQNQTQGSQGGSQGSQNQSSAGNQTQSQGAFVSTLVDDEPDMTTNVRIRVIHASSDLPAIDILLDGEVLFSNVSLGNVTQYAFTIRGIHNITVLPALNSSSQSNTSSSNMSVSIVAFFGWRTTYTIAIVSTENSMENSNQESGGASQGGINSTQNATAQNSSETSSSQMTPSNILGYRGPNHQILVDQISENATLGQNLAYVQVVHLAPNISAVDISVGNYRIMGLQFLNTSQYINVSASGLVNITVTHSEDNSLVARATSQVLQARTLYTIWIVERQNGIPRVFATTDRRVQIRCVIDDEDQPQNE